MLSPCAPLLQAFKTHARNLAEFSTLLNNAKTSKDTDVLKERRKEMFATVRALLEVLVGPITNIASDDGTLVVKVAMKQFALYSPFGRRINRETYEATSGFHEGLAAVKDVLGWTYIDNKGIEKLPSSTSPEYPIYDHAEPFVQGVAFVQTMESGRNSRDYWRMIDKRGAFISKKSFENVLFMRQHNRALVCNDKSGMYRRNGQLAWEVHKEWKLLDLQGHTIKEKFEITFPYVAGDLFVETGKDGRMFDKNGELVNSSLSK